MWKNYLPGTPEERFDWLDGANPAGRTLWLGAFDRESAALVGMASIMPRIFSMHGRAVSAGVMGDFVVVGHHRVFGPALRLPQAALAMCKEAGFRMVYTVPNRAAAAVMERAGFNRRRDLGVYVRPIATRHFVQKRAGVLVVCAPLADLALRFALPVTTGSAASTVTEERAADESFDVFWERLKASSDSMIGDRSAAFLNWRYFANPHARFRLLTIRRGPGLLAYAFFTTQQSRLEVYELMSWEATHTLALLSRITEIGRRERCKAVYLTVADTDPILRSARRCLFLHAQESTSFLLSSFDADVPEPQLSIGDRNL